MGRKEKMLSGIKGLKLSASIPAYPEIDCNLDEYIIMGLPLYKIVTTSEVRTSSV